MGSEHFKLFPQQERVPYSRTPIESKEGVQKRGFAYLFDGHGAQGHGMARDLYPHYKSIQRKYAVASDELGWDLAEVSFYGSEEDLNRTVIAQPAIVVDSDSCLEALGEDYPDRFSKEPQFVGYQSLGVMNAAHRAGVFGDYRSEDSFRSMVRITAVRAELMQEVCDQIDSGLMVVQVGRKLFSPTDAQRELLHMLMEEVSGGEYRVHLALDINSAKFIIGGLKPDLLKVQEDFLDRFKTYGVRSGMLRGASGAFHTPLMQGVVEPFRQFLMEEVKIYDPKIPLISNTRQDPVRLTTKEEVVREMMDLFTKPVMGQAVAEFFDDSGIAAAYNIGRTKIVMDSVEGDSRFSLPERIDSKKLAALAGGAAALGVGAVTAYKMTRNRK